MAMSHSDKSCRDKRLRHIDKRLRLKDEVMVLSGRDKGRTGTVERILGDGRAIVSGIHMVKKHRRPNPQLNEVGGIVEQESPIHMSNLALVHPDTGRPARIGRTQGKDGKRIRVFRSDKKPVPTKSKGGK